jgi:hypothetical protein
MSTRPLETIEEYRDKKSFLRLMGLLFIAAPALGCVVFQVLQGADLQGFATRVANFFPLGR